MCFISKPTCFYSLVVFYLDENEIEEKKASRSRAITALNIMIPEKDKIKRVSSNNDEEPVGTASGD